MQRSLRKGGLAVFGGAAVAALAVAAVSTAAPASGQAHGRTVFTRAGPNDEAHGLLGLLQRR